MLVLIDGDIIRYSVGFAADGEPLENCLHSVKLMINKIIQQTDADEYEVFLTGEGNYRDKVATIKPYKGNRDSSHKPTFYKEITEYLITQHNATVVNGREADDAMGYTSYKDDTNHTVIASIDKDMDMIPGWHYNWKKDKLYFIEEDDANRNFYRQLLTGDSTDNITGVPGIGPKRAEKILNASVDIDDDFEDEPDEEEIYWRILEQYSLHYERPFEAMMENATLLWILREKPEDGEEPPYWTPPY